MLVPQQLAEPPFPVVIVCPPAISIFAEAGVACSHLIVTPTIPDYLSTLGLKELKRFDVDAAILFTDIRGFTSFSEKHSPEELVAVLNQYMKTAADAVLAEEGTIDKFMGDAVMAFWNAPLDHDDHARAACRAALNMRDSVAALNRSRRAEAEDEDVQDINIGIGISSGSCMVGNMGLSNLLAKRKLKASPKVRWFKN